MEFWRWWAESRKKSTWFGPISFFARKNPKSCKMNWRKMVLIDGPTNYVRQSGHSVLYWLSQSLFYNRLISRPTTLSSLLPEALIKSFTTCQFYWVTQLNVNINLLPVILFFFDVTFLDPTICEWQQFTRMKGIYHLPSKFSLTSCAITKRFKPD